MLPGVTQTLPGVSRVKKIGFARQYLEARRWYRVGYRHRRDPVVQHLELLEELDRVQAKNRVIRTGIAKEIGIQAAVQQLFGHEFYGIRNGVYVHRLAGVPYSNAQGQQVAHMVEVPVGQDYRVYAPLFLEGQRPGKTAGV